MLKIATSSYAFKRSLEEGKFYLIHYEHSDTLHIVYTFKRTTDNTLGMVSLTAPCMYWSNVEDTEWEVIEEYKSNDILIVE